MPKQEAQVCLHCHPQICKDFRVFCSTCAAMNKEATNEAYRKAGALQMLAPFASFVVAAALTAGKKKRNF